MAFIEARLPEAFDNIRNLLPQTVRERIEAYKIGHEAMNRHRARNPYVVGNLWTTLVFEKDLLKRAERLSDPKVLNTPEKIWPYASFIRDILSKAFSTVRRRFF